jgi:hypothetical protein
MKRGISLVAPAVFFLLMMMAAPVICNAWWFDIAFGTDPNNPAQHRVQVRTGDETGQTSDFQLICISCHNADVKLKAALAKPYNLQSQLNHQQKYFKERSIPIASLKRYDLDRDVYLAVEAGRLVLVHGREHYKVIFSDDAVVLRDGQNRPTFIQGIKSYTRTPIGPYPALQKR